MTSAELEADDPRALTAAASRTQRESEQQLQHLWPALILARQQYGTCSQEYQTVLRSWKQAQTLWWENTMMLMGLG
jgi:hypothetical protein